MARRFFLGLVDCDYCRETMAKHIHWMQIAYAKAHSGTEDVVSVNFTFRLETMKTSNR